MQGDERITAKIAKFWPSLTLAWQGLVGERQALGLSVYDFGLGAAKGMLDPTIRDAGEKAFREEDTMYSDPAGIHGQSMRVGSRVHIRTVERSREERVWRGTACPVSASATPLTFCSRWLGAPTH